MTRRPLLVMWLSTMLTSALALTGATAARADDRTTCAEAYTSGQALRDSGAFGRAREALAVCARPVCKEWMVAECVGWLTDVERREPTVVLFAEGPRGESIDVVEVTLDGEAFAHELDGRALSLDPGRHTLTFVARDGATASVSKVIAEGQKSMPIRVTFEAPAPAAATGSGSPEAPRPASATASAMPSRSSWWRTTGWILGGVGVVGLGAGAALGLVALNEKSDSCDARGVCDPGTASGVRRAALLSDVGLIAGSALLAGGVALVLLAPRSSAAPSASLQLSPAIGPTSGALMVGGHFR